MMTTQDMLASVDLGSNSFRLQICHHQNGQLKVVDSIKEMVRFAAGLNDQKILDEASQQRALACLARFGERLRGFEPHQVRAVATNTFRVAKNIAQFVPQAEAALGFPIDIIAGREEARLIYTGVVHSIPTNGQRMLVVDIGGGSTEFVIGRHVHPDITESLNLGCVTYSLRFFSKNKISNKDFQAAIHAARTEVQRIRHGLTTLGWDMAVGTSGSARSIRDVIEAADSNAAGITLAHMQAIAAQIVAAGNTKKAKLDGLKPDRIEVFAGGLAVMMAVFEELGTDNMQVTDAALRDGVFYDLIGRQLHDDMRDQTVLAFQQHYKVDQAQATRVADLATSCLSALTPELSTQAREPWLQCVRWAAALHEIGLAIAHTGYHKHAAYILEQADMPGFSRKEQSILSTLVLGHRGDLRKMNDYIDQPMLWLSVLSLRLAALWYRARLPLSLPPETRLRYHADEKQFTLCISQAWLDNNPLTASALEQESALWGKINHRFVLQYL